ncbi:MAG: hypothetical protein ACOCU7_07185 [Tangfeifania sp.]
MNEKKEQKIVVLTHLVTTDKTLILNGIKIASIFNKELCLVYHYTKKEKSKRDIIRQKLQEYLVPVKNEIPALKTSVMLIPGPISEMPELLADDYEAILFITESFRFKSYAKATASSPVPFLFIHPEAPVSMFSKIVMPVDIRQENSDAALWCSWFGRFNQAEVAVIGANDKNREMQKMVGHNILLTKKLFNKFQIRHKVYKGRKSSLGNAFEALEMAKSSESDLLVILGSSTITPLDWVIGLPERKIIKQAEKLPVLFINPRRDNYILCD